MGETHDKFSGENWGTMIAGRRLSGVQTSIRHKLTETVLPKGHNLIGLADRAIYMPGIVENNRQGVEFNS